MTQMPAQPPASDLPSSPWVLLDDDTAGQVAGLLEQLTSWLLTAPEQLTSPLAQAISDGDSDAAGIAYWTDALAARIRHCTRASEL